MTSLPCGPISPQLKVIHPAHQHSQPLPLTARLPCSTLVAVFHLMKKAVMGGGRLTFVLALTAAPGERRRSLQTNPLRSAPV